MHEIYCQKTGSGEMTVACKGCGTAATMPYQGEWPGMLAAMQQWVAEHKEAS